MSKTLKEKIKAGQKICGTHVQLGDPEICAIYGQMGYDYIWLDMEHSCISYREALNAMNAARMNGTPVIVRVPQDDLTVTKKIMEMGPEGIIFPMVHTAEEANRLIGYTLYPPYGNRGCGPMRAINYGGDSLEEYVNRTHLDKTCRFIQIESRTAIENLEEIVKNPYIDGFVFGPCDLSNTLGDNLNVKGDINRAWMEKAIRILKENGKYIGISYGDTGTETIGYWHDMGIDMISVGSDFGYLYECGMKALQNLKAAHTTRL